MKQNIDTNNLFEKNGFSSSQYLVNKAKDGDADGAPAGGWESWDSSNIPVNSQ